MSRSAPVEIDFGGEGRTDAEAARKMILAAGGTPGRDFTQRTQARGKDALDRRLAGYNAAARFTPVLLLRDLDEAPCPGELVLRCVPVREEGLLLRIAVRELEAWLLADKAALATFAKIDVASLPDRPETLDKPKERLIDALKGSRTGAIQKQLFVGGERPTFQMLGEWTANFIRQAWDPRRAAASGLAPSLDRAMDRLSRVAAA